MNRQIKFRVWDVEQNKFLSSYADKGIEFYHEQGKDWHEKQVRDIVPVSWFLKDHNNNLANYIVTQYTGLNDKNGKEIYEGDILNVWNGLFVNKIGQVVYEVDHGGYIFQYNRHMSSIYHINLNGYVVRESVKLGNIFEHSKLLKAKYDCHLMDYVIE